MAFCKNLYTNNGTESKNVCTDFYAEIVLTALVRLRGGCYVVHVYRLFLNTWLYFTMAHKMVKSWTAGRPQVAIKPCIIGRLTKPCKVGFKHAIQE